MPEPADLYLRLRAGDEEAFLRPLPVFLLPGVEREDLIRLREFHISQVGQVGRWTYDQLYVVFGNRGRNLYQAVRGVDPSPVLPVGQKPPQLKADREFGNDTNEAEVVEAALYGLVERIGQDLRHRGRVARRVGLMLDYSDGVRVIRQRSFKRGTANDFKLFALAKEALDLAWKRRVRLRHMRLMCDRLAYPPAQLELFPLDEQDAKAGDNLVAAMDRIRSRLGAGMIQMGRGFSREAA